MDEQRVMVSGIKNGMVWLVERGKEIWRDMERKGKRGKGEGEGSTYLHQVLVEGASIHHGALSSSNLGSSH